MKVGGLARRVSNNVYACISDDDGRTWRYGKAAANNTGVDSELQMVELSDGSVLLNARSLNGHKCRKIAVSHDGGDDLGTSS